jgi:hypothetical protein
MTKELISPYHLKRGPVYLDVKSCELQRDGANCLWMQPCQSVEWPAEGPLVPPPKIYSLRPFAPVLLRSLLLFS